MEPADKKRLNWVRVGSLLSEAFTQTQSNSSHLESLKPAQRRAEEDFRKERERQWEQKERKVSETEKKEDDRCPQVLICSRVSLRLLRRKKIWVYK